VRATLPAPIHEPEIQSMTANREAFKADEDGYCASYGLNDE